MKTIHRSILAAALGLSTLSALAQGPGGPPPRDDSSGPPPRRDGPGPDRPMPPEPGRGPDRPFRPEPPLFAILDSNHDGVIDSEEIVNASLVLARLAKEHGGSIRLEDMGPRRMRREMRREWGPGPRGPMMGGPGGERGPGRFGPPPGGPDEQFDGPGGPRGPMMGGPGGERGPGRFGPPRGGPDQQFDGPGGPRGPMREGPDGERGPGRFGPPRGGPDQQFDGPGGDRGPDRAGPPPSPRGGNPDGRPEGGLRRQDDGGRPGPDGNPPPRPRRPAPDNGDERTNQPGGPVPPPREN